MTDVVGAHPLPPDLHRQAGAKQIVMALVRIFGAMAALLLVYFMFPLTDKDNVTLGLVSVVVGLTVFGLIVARQLHRIRTAAFPLLRAAEAIVLVATFFIVLMSTIATAFSTSDPSAYSEDLSRMDSLYFSVTTLATVGYGDITPTSPTTRAFTTVQILLGVVLLGVGLRALFSVAQRENENRQRSGP